MKQQQHLLLQRSIISCVYVAPKLVKKHLKVNEILDVYFIVVPNRFVISFYGKINKILNLLQPTPPPILLLLPNVCVLKKPLYERLKVQRIQVERFTVVLNPESNNVRFSTGQMKDLQNLEPPHPILSLLLFLLLVIVIKPPRIAFRDLRQIPNARSLPVRKTRHKGVHFFNGRTPIMRINMLYLCSNRHKGRRQDILLIIIMPYCVIVIRPR